ncbi:MAG: OmpA family protein [Thermodesulfobacteriota bacterium]
MKKMLLAACSLFLVFSLPLSAEADCARSRSLYEQALAEQDLTRRIELLKASTIACRDFAAYYELGRAYAQAGRNEEARQAFLDAVNLASNNQALAWALAGLGQVLAELGQDHEASVCLRQSFQKHPYPKVLDKLKEIETRLAGRPLTAAQITRALSFRGFSADPVQPSVNLRHILFEYDSALLTDQGQAQVGELGQALSGPSLNNTGIIIIGHTDKRGADEYNQVLSERRAAAVRDYLIGRFRLQPGLIAAEGRGKKELLYPGDDEQDHALNRRVEVKVR